MTPDEMKSFARRLLEGTLAPDQFAAMFAQVEQERAAVEQADTGVEQAGAGGAQANKRGAAPCAGGEGASRLTADLGEARIDLDRRRRCGFPEVVFGEGKSVETLSKIFRALLAAGVEVLATRVDAEKGRAVCAEFPEARYNELGRTVRIDTAPPTENAVVSGEQQSKREKATRGRVAIVTAGSSDRPVAEEARETLDWMGVETRMVHDIGVAGPHRLPDQLSLLTDCDAIVVIAGMEGALPSVVGGYVSCPVIGVPTSVGYGANFGGVAPLLAMLNSCAANVAVVNIDAGFKGAYLAGMIARGRGGEG